MQIFVKRALLGVRENGVVVLVQLDVLSHRKHITSRMRATHDTAESDPETTLLYSLFDASYICTKHTYV